MKHAIRRCHGAAALAGAAVWLAVAAGGSLLSGSELSESKQPAAAEARSHWAFQPVVRPSVPAVRETSRVRTPIDAFILSRLEERGLTLSAPADRRQLLRRAKYDLLGLPPTPEEIEEFLADRAPGAWERLIDRLLESPHYGEAWGRDWLDLVRYAETAGYNADPVRPLAYKYRDYVIRAFNEDTPYDRFLQEQIAGDELFPGDVNALAATGYNRMWPDESNASNVLLARQDALNDLTANVGAVFLGLSVGCAQCHDHKFDPIPQRDFYALQAFFSGIVPEDRVPVGTPEQLADYRARRRQWLEETGPVRHELHAIETPARQKAAAERRQKFPAIVLDAIDAMPEERTAFQRQLVFWSERQIELNEEMLLAQLTDEEQARREALQKRLAELEQARPRPPGEARVMAAVEVEPTPPATHLLAGGSYDQPLDEVPPGFLTVLTSREAGRPTAAGPQTASQAGGPPGRPHHAGTSGRRAALARWLSDPRHQLVPRVMVNRLWQGHFGRGLVEAANDFGTQTPPPTHPELLDWLASEFVARGFSLKAMHRLIMTSEVYRQSALSTAGPAAPPAGATTDPDNELYWHFPRRRLTAERVRDALLAVSGTLNPALYGPGVRPELPPNYSAREAWSVSQAEPDRRRRSVYIFAKRNLPYPLLDAFDFPDMHESCGRRAETITAPQALMLLNSHLVLDAARAMAGRLLDGAKAGGECEPAALVRRAWVLALGREPDQEETAAALEFLERQKSLTGQRLDRGDALALPEEGAGESDPAAAAALVDFCHALLNTNEFLYVD